MTRLPGRGVAELLADHGTPLPPSPQARARRAARPGPAAVTGPSRPAQQDRGDAGRLRRPGAGWAPVRAPLAVHRMTSEQAGGVWPLIAGDGLEPTGALMGVDYLSGGAFYADPVGWTLRGTAGVTNPNVMIFGAPGQGKSSTIKTFCLRMMAYGYRTLVLGDVKDEYEPLAAALGVATHAVGHGLPARINPLDIGPLRHGWRALPAAEAQRRAALVFSRWLALLRGLVASQHVAFDPSAETVVTHAMRELTGYAAGATRLREITLPQLWRALDEPSPQLVTACRYASRQHLLDQTRPVRDALGTLVTGHLAGLFDDRTTVQVDWRAPLQSLSLSRLAPLGDEAVGVALTCLNSWGRAMTHHTRHELTDGDRAGGADGDSDGDGGVAAGAAAAPGGQGGPDLRIVVRDEAWKQMRLGVDAVKSLDADLRLSRAEGCIQLIAAHKPSDMLSVGDASSQAVAIARDLLHLCGTKILLGQDDRIGQELAALLALPALATPIVTDWASAGKGRALWIVGSRYFKVQPVASARERRLTDTNAALVHQPPGGAGRHDGQRRGRPDRGAGPATAAGPAAAAAPAGPPAPAGAGRPGAQVAHEAPSAPGGGRVGTATAAGWRP